MLQLIGNHFIPEVSCYSFEKVSEAWEKVSKSKMFPKSNSRAKWQNMFCYTFSKIFLLML